MKRTGNFIFQRGSNAPSFPSSFASPFIHKDQINFGAWKDSFKVKNAVYIYFMLLRCISDFFCNKTTAWFIENQYKDTTISFIYILNYYLINKFIFKINQAVKWNLKFQLNKWLVTSDSYAIQFFNQWQLTTSAKAAIFLRI